MIHVRGRLPDSLERTASGVPLLGKDLIESHIKTVNERIQNGLMKKVVVSAKELEKLGKKDAEKFVKNEYVLPY